MPNMALANDGDDWRDAPLINASKTKLQDALKPRKTQIHYLYEFGDSWEHELTITARRAREPGQAYPSYLDGEQNGPPDDCGGIPGFYEALDALANPKHPDHGEYDPASVNWIAARCRIACPGAFLAGEMLDGQGTDRRLPPPGLHGDRPCGGPRGARRAAVRLLSHFAHGGFESRHDNCDRDGTHDGRRPGDARP
jgi:Plasmid pRiA4b ORF-3-like protein